MSNISEFAKLAAKGDRAAFDSLYEQTKSGVWFTCINLLKNEENAKDIMQDTYLAAFENLSSLTDFSGVQSWLNRIAANKCKNYIKSKSNSALVEDSEEILENIPDDKLIPEEYVTDMAKRKIIMDIIEKSLSEEQYRTIILYYFDEMTAAEIAELMDCHRKTVLYRLKTARLKIKEEVMRYEEKNKDRLHAVVFVPLLTQLLRLEAENTSVPNVPIKFNVPPNTQKSVPSNAAASAAKQGGKTMLNTLKAKIIAGACAAAVVGGGVTAGVVISNSSKNNTTSTPAVSASADVSKPTNASTPANITSKPAESSATESVPTQSIVNEPTEFPENPISETGEVMWDLIPTASAEDFKTSRHTVNNVEQEGEIRISKYLGKAEYVKIPKTIDGKTVVYMQGFSFNNNIKGVYIPDGVTDIGYDCFRTLENLKYVRLPETLDKIATKGFNECNSLESLMLPESTRVLMDAAIVNCKNLKKVVVPDSIETIFSYPIVNCPECELHYRGYVFTEDDMESFKLLDGKLTFNGQTFPVDEIAQYLGGGTSSDSANSNASSVSSNGDTSANSESSDTSSDNSNN